ncbi:MAG: class I SAM-dependent methyltransferase [Chloroflexi bacterium]|nr:class I SAM-dependent methyltransferase [Chloroflexota bacterium]
MDKVTIDNKVRWEELAQANVSFSRPLLTLDATTARQLLDPQQHLGDVAGKNVLCLASGGGQQSVAFAWLGAHVTVYDLAETQLARDQVAAAHYGFAIQTVQGDMRDLACFATSTFDIVWQPPSINYVPDARCVFAEVARVLRRGGLYRLDFDNPFVMGLDERDWNGVGYALSQPYVDSAEVERTNPCWEVWDEAGHCQLVKAPRQFRHTLDTVINGLIEQGFILLTLAEDLNENSEALPGTWDHFKLVAPPIFSLWSRYCPGLFASDTTGSD